MPTPKTHMYLIFQIFCENINLNLFKKLNLDYVYQGAAFPDITHVLKHDSDNFDLHQDINFGKKLVEKSHSIEERSFAVGYLSHLIIDEYLHNTLRELKIEKLDHLFLEYFLESKIKFNKLIPLHKFPKKLFQETLAEAQKDFQPNYSILTLVEYSFKIYCLQQYIQRKFSIPVSEPPSESKSLDDVFNDKSLNKTLQFNLYSFFKQQTRDFVENQMIKHFEYNSKSEFKTDSKRIKSLDFSWSNEEIQTIENSIDSAKKEVIAYLIDLNQKTI